MRSVESPDPGGTGVVERYLQCLAAHDWDGLADTIADAGLTREGPFRDVIEGQGRIPGLPA